MQSQSIVYLDLRLFNQNTQTEFNFLVLYITKFRKISSYDAVEMMEQYERTNWIDSSPISGHESQILVYTQQRPSLDILYLHVDSTICNIPYFFQDSQEKSSNLEDTICIQEGDLHRKQIAFYLWSFAIAEIWRKPISVQLSFLLLRKTYFWGRILYFESIFNTGIAKKDNINIVIQLEFSMIVSSIFFLLSSVFEYKEDVNKHIYPS